MKTFRLPNGQLYNLSNWFPAKITKVCPVENDGDCSNTACSWTQLQYCENMQTFTEEPGLLSGDCDTGLNVAYPLDGLPAENSYVLMRYRGTVNQIDNVFEFIGGSGESLPELPMTALQCSAGTLTATFSSGCTKQ